MKPPDGRPAQPEKKKRTRGPVPTGTPRGWTLWSTASTCWRLFLLKHVLALFPVKLAEPLIVGTLYHALLDNWSVDGLKTFGPEYIEHIPLAVKLYEARLSGPPLPKATAAEKTHTLAFGMTSKPDREELGFGRKPIVRDFKSAAFFSDHDDKRWQTNGGIIGEVIAVPGAEMAIVDVICKREGDSFGRVQQFEVPVGEREREALEQQVNDLRSQIHMRVDEAVEAAALNDVTARAKLLKQAFPKNLNGCVGHYGPCSHYDRCWSNGPEKHLFEQRQRSGYAWLKDEGDAELTRKVSELSDAYVGLA